MNPPILRRIMHTLWAVVALAVVYAVLLLGQATGAVYLAAAEYGRGARLISAGTAACSGISLRLLSP